MDCRQDSSQHLREATIDHNPSTTPALPRDTVGKILTDTEDMTSNISEDTRILTIYVYVKISLFFMNTGVCFFTKINGNMNTIRPKQSSPEVQFPEPEFIVVDGPQILRKRSALSLNKLNLLLRRLEHLELSV